MADEEKMTRRQPSHASIDRPWIRNIAIREEIFDRLWIDLTVDLRAEQQRLQLRRKQQSTVGQKTIIERLLAQPVAREEQRFASGVPQRERKHAIEPLEASLAPLLPGVNDHFGIAASAKNMAQCSKLGHQRLEIIDLAVKNDTDGAIFVK